MQETNNDLLQKILTAIQEGGGGGGTVGKSQLLSENGTIAADNTVVVILGGEDFTIANPISDGQVMVLLNSPQGALDITGNVQGSQQTWPVDAGYSLVWFISVDLGGGLTWLVAAPSVPTIP